MKTRFLASLFLSGVAILSYGQVSPDLKAIEDTNSLASQREDASSRLNRVKNAKAAYAKQKDLRSTFAFMSAAYRLLNGVDAAQAFNLKKEAFVASKSFRIKDRYFTGVRVGLAVDTYNSVEAIGESEWLMKTFPDQPFFKFRYLQCATCGKDSHQRSKEFLSLSAKLVKQFPENAQYLILDAFLNNVYARNRAAVKIAISKYEQCLNLKLSEDQKSYVNRHLTSARKSLQYFKN